jgi:hypothetical protein
LSPEFYGDPNFGADFFESRGVASEVVEARPYIYYPKGDPERIVAKHWPNDKKYGAKIARQSAGVVIPRYAPPSLRLPYVPAELRPGNEVETSSHHHYHGDASLRNIVLPSGKKLPKKWIHKPENMRRHIERDHGGINDQTVHLDSNIAKYVFPTGEGAKRLDVHPHAWPKL